MLDHQAAIGPWLPIATAPRDGTSLLLLIEGGELPLQDDHVSVSIGAYGVHGGSDEDPTWDFAGWSWHHDCYCRGDGKPVGWLPLPAVMAGSDEHLARALHSGD